MLRREFTQSGHVPPAPKPPRNPYAGAADRIRAGANEIEDEKKIGYKDIPPSQPAPDLQAGLQALYEGRKAGETAQEKPWWEKVGDWIAPKASYIVDATVAAKSAWDLRHLKFRPLPSGNVSVSASGLSRGMRADYFKNVVNPDFNFRPGPYKPSTVDSIVKGGLIN